MKANLRALGRAVLPHQLGVLRVRSTRAVVLVAAAAYSLIIPLQLTGHLAFIHHRQLFGGAAALAVGVAVLLAGSAEVVLP